MSCKKPTHWAILYLVTLAIAVLFGWYLAASDLVSIQVLNSRLTDVNGVAQQFYRPGQDVVIHREFCLTGYVQFTATPSLVDAAGTVYPLASGVYATGRGCKKASYAFTLPNVPAGSYTLNSTFTYQNGPLNEDSHMVLPKLKLEVRP